MTSSVKGLIKCKLDLKSITQIKTLQPDLIRFTYVNKDTLAVLKDWRVPTVLSQTTSRAGYDQRSGFLRLTAIE